MPPRNTYLRKINGKGDSAKMAKIAFIGAGSIADVLINNLINRYGASPKDVAVSNPSRPKLEYMSNTYRVAVFDDNSKAIEWGDYIFVCVRPQAVPSVIGDMKTADMKGKTVISITSGIPIAHYREELPDVYLTRALPNPPSRIGEGAIPVTLDDRMPDEKKVMVLAMLSAMDPCFPVSEEKIDVFTSVTSPAPTFAFFEALVDSAVYCGVDYKTACSMVKQTIKGCLALWEQGDENISSHLIECCTPGGTSVESLRVMDRGAFKSTVKEAYIAAYEKSRSYASKTVGPRPTPRKET